MSRAPRICPHCKIEVSIFTGYIFDDSLTMSCAECKKIIFPTTSANETEFDRRHYSYYYPKTDVLPAVPSVYVPTPPVSHNVLRTSRHYEHDPKYAPFGSPIAPDD